MPKLEHLLNGMNGVQSKLNEADTMKADTEGYLGKRFDESDQKLDKSLKNVLKEQSEQAVFASAVHQTVLQVAQNNQLMLHNMINDLKALEGQVREQTSKLKKELGGDLGKLNTQATKNGTEIGNKLSEVGNDITKAIGNIPVPKATDLTGLSKDIKRLEGAIKSIPKTIIPEQKDLTGSFKSLEKMIKNRTHTFEVEREQFGDKLIKTITATSK
jgi:hypothetical protein